MLEIERSKIESAEKWREAINVIPFVKFPADWLVQVIPPFAGAIARFRVKLPSGTVKSVYLDFYGRLGYYCNDDGSDKEYWEVYPYQDDVGRCDMADTDTLLEMIADENERPTSTPREGA